MNDIKTHLNIYYTELKGIVRKGAFNEHTFRTPLENLLNALKPANTPLSTSQKRSKDKAAFALILKSINKRQIMKPCKVSLSAKIIKKI